VRRLPSWLSPTLVADLAPVPAPAAGAGTGRRLPWLLAYWMDRGWVVAVPSVLVLLAVMVDTAPALAPLRSLIRALAGSVNSYRDGEYNFGIYWPGEDDSATWCAHRELGDVLREQRQALVQRELLLDTMVQNTPVAMLLIAPGGDGIAASCSPTWPRASCCMAAGSWKASASTSCWPVPVTARSARSAAATACSRSATKPKPPTTAKKTSTTSRAGNSAQRPRARPAADPRAHRRAAPAGSADLEEGDPGDQPRAQQFAGADGFAGALRG
jgi:hypothetical protein